MLEDTRNKKCTQHLFRQIKFLHEKEELPTMLGSSLLQFVLQGVHFIFVICPCIRMLVFNTISILVDVCVFNSNSMGVNSGAGTGYPSTVNELQPDYLVIHSAQSLVFCVMFMWVIVCFSSFILSVILWCKTSNNPLISPNFKCSQWSCLFVVFAGSRRRDDLFSQRRSQVSFKQNLVPIGPVVSKYEMLLMMTDAK